MTERKWRDLTKDGNEGDRGDGDEKGGGIIEKEK